METKNILVSQAIRFISVAEPVLEKRSPVPLIDGLREKYGFVQVPQTVADLDFKKGVNFLQGYYKSRVIDKFQVYENGLLCEANENTDLLDEFISEILAWVEQEQKLPIKETGVRAYVSQMEVIATVDIGSIFSKIASIGPLISKELSNYGQLAHEYKISGLKMHYDAAPTPLPRAPDFSFERRAGMAYSENQFFTSAPVRTDEHLRIVRILEDLLN
jgi:hypothetical protein